MKPNTFQTNKSIIYGNKKFSLIDGSCDIPRASIVRLIAELGDELKVDVTVLVVGRYTSRDCESASILEVAAKSRIATDWDTIAFAALASDEQLPELLIAAELFPVAIFSIQRDPNATPRVQVSN